MLVNVKPKTWRMLLWTAAFAVPFGTAATSQIERSPEEAVQTALVIAYDSTTKDQSARAGLESLVASGCEVWRRGQVEKVRGTLDLGSIDRIALLRCAKPALSAESGRRMALASFSSGGTGFAVEGNFDVFEAPPATPAQAAGRGYVVKLSYFNNLEVNRESEEDEIDIFALTKPTGWKREARVYVTRASGIATPDAFGVLYFPSPKARDEFRDMNPDVMQSIARFNEKHLTQRAYLYITPEPVE